MSNERNLKKNMNNRLVIVTIAIIFLFLIKAFVVVSILENSEFQYQTKHIDKEMIFNNIESVYIRMNINDNNSVVVIDNNPVYELTEFTIEIFIEGINLKRSMAVTFNEYYRGEIIISYFYEIGSSWIINNVYMSIEFSDKIGYYFEENKTYISEILNLEEDYQVFQLMNFYEVEYIPEFIDNLFTIFIPLFFGSEIMIIEILLLELLCKENKPINQLKGEKINV